MFKVTNDGFGFVINVYATTMDKNNNIAFLIYYDNKWQWMDSENWKPYIDK